MTSSFLARSLPSRVCAILPRAFFLSVLVTTVATDVQAQDQYQGKLFTTDYEREYLDYLRRNFQAERAASGFNIDNVPPPIIEEDQDTEAPEAAPVLYTLGGIIQRSGNHRSVWLNNRLIAEDELPENLSIADTQDGLVLRVRGEERNYQLKSGQTLNMNTGEILESFQAPARSAPDSRSQPAPRQPGATNLPFHPPGQNVPETA